MKADASRRGGLSAASLEYVDLVNEILTQLQEYWPLTLRQVYYQLVSRMVIANAQREYKKLSRVLTKARLARLVPWDALEDRTRDRLVSGGWQDRRHFVEQELGEFLDGYRRDLLQSQVVAPEVWVEKDALSRVCHRAAFGYCVPVVVARGFSSLTFLHECRQRVQMNARAGKQTVLLYFGDMDPSGWEMLPAMLRTLKQDMGLGTLVEGLRCALTPEQIERYQLPKDPEALKPTDTRAKKYAREFGDLAVELDALSPTALEELVRESIASNLDMDLFGEERAQEDAEQGGLALLKERVVEFVEGAAC